MMSYTLNLATILDALKTTSLGKAPGWENELWDSIDSTNVRAKQLAKEGAPHGLFVAARRQTAGKGRLGRAWISPPDSGLYISILLRPAMPLPSITKISFVAGVAAAESIETVNGYRPGLKWVNDLVTSDGRKLGGILCEMTGTGEPDFAVIVGIGINVYEPPSVPHEISTLAAWLDKIVGHPCDINLLAAMLLKSFESQFELMVRDGNELLRRWKQHSVTLGSHVRAHIGQTIIEGLASDISDDGSLILELESGQIMHLHAGDVSIRKADGTYS